MAYFSNGEAGNYYELNVCSHCVHHEQCTVLLLHMVFNYDQIKRGGERDKSHFLQALIPDGADGYPGLCTMFYNPDPEISGLVNSKF